CMMALEGERLSTIGARYGLPDGFLAPYLEDRGGNCWFVTVRSGILRLTRNGIVTYGSAEGLGGIEFSTFDVGAEDIVYAYGRDTGPHLLSQNDRGGHIPRLDGERWMTVPPLLAPSIRRVSPV